MNERPSEGYLSPVATDPEPKQVDETSAPEALQGTEPEAPETAEAEAEASEAEAPDGGVTTEA